MVSDRQINCKLYIQRCLGVVAAFLTLPHFQATPQSLDVSEPTQIYQLATPQKLTIPPQELGGILPNSFSEKVKDEQDLLAPPLFNPIVTREFPGLWQMRVPIDQVGSLYATYDLKGVNGQVDGFSNNQRGDQAMQVSVEPLPIIEISRDEATNTALVQGGVRLRFDLSTARTAGSYGGVLSVTVNRRE
ncbi:hypothetical protein CEN47_15805 [Fischerella thermalis CCMEE 5319]|nr:hypothetical protein CEN47_15805 [Fischerella thermalis CCMEE 5319]